jgi:hypothetical protein
MSNSNCSGAVSYSPLIQLYWAEAGGFRLGNSAVNANALLAISKSSGRERLCVIIG